MPRLIEHRIPITLKHFTLKTKINFSLDKKRNCTAMQLITLDRAGLLARLAKALLECNIRLRHAKIVTIGERTEDYFLITDQDNQPITDSALQEQLAEKIRLYL